MEAFFNTILKIGTIILGALYVLRRECDTDFQRIEGSLGDEWYRIQAHIWTSDVKNSLNELIQYISNRSTTFIKSGSADPMTDIFSDSTQLTTLKNRLNEMKNDYESYNQFNEVLSDYSSKNHELKKWLDYAFLISILSVFWGGGGLYLIYAELTETKYYLWLWNAGYILLCGFLVTFIKILYNYNRVRVVRRVVRVQKSRYVHVTREG